MSDILGTVSDNLAPFWVELSFLLFFSLGFALLRGEAFFGRTPGKAKVSTKQSNFSEKTKKEIEANVSAGHFTEAIEAWKNAQGKAPTPPELWKSVLPALLEAAPESLEDEVIDHMRLHVTSANMAKTATSILETLGRLGKIEMMDDLWKRMQSELRCRRCLTISEVLLAGYAGAGRRDRVISLLSELKAEKRRLSSRAHSLMIKGFLKNGMLDSVFERMTEMKAEGCPVPMFAIIQFLRVASDNGRAVEMMESLKDANLFRLTSDGMTSIIDDCLKSNNLKLAKKVHDYLLSIDQPLTTQASEVLLRLYALHGENRAVQLFQDMDLAGNTFSDGLCSGLLARCAESKFLRFAEEIARYRRRNQGMTISLYSALMKVYAYCNMFDKACDLYDQILQDGLEPDDMMYGCLMKFAVECGRTKLSQELSAKVSKLDIQNYMSLMKAAAREGDLDRAFLVLQRLKDDKVTPDIGIYNCLLDVCVQLGETKRARDLVLETQRLQLQDAITWNTLMKGYASQNDLPGAKQVLADMEASGIVPNDVTFNCLINCAVSIGRYNEAWDFVAMMEDSGIKVDHYTISIMMKSLKKIQRPKDLKRALELLDRSGIDVCSDEILFNAVLETFIRNKEFRRMKEIISSFHKSSLHPSVHTYASLIKASAAMKELDQCWYYWNQISKKGLELNDIVLGCMMDALVCNQRVEEAVTLFNEWKDKFTLNSVLYSTLVKGFANTHQYDRAMDMWREMKQNGIAMNTVLFNAIIDAQARVGNMDNVSILVEDMAATGIAPDSITHSTIVKGYCVKGDLDRAFQIFREMQEKNLAKDAVVYNTILDGCVRNNRFDLSEEMLKLMEDLNIPPSNFTLGIVIKMYGRMKQLPKAFEALQSVPRKGNFKPNVQVYGSLMCACLQNHETDQALEVFAKMKEVGDVDMQNYCVLVNGMIRHGQLLHAIGIIDELFGTTKSSKSTPIWRRSHGNDCLEHVHHLMTNLAKQGLLEQHGMPLFERLRAANVPVSAKMLNAACGSENDNSGGKKQSGSRR